MSETKTGKIGRPAVNATPVTVRVLHAQLERIDKWAQTQPGRLSRPEAMRQLIDKALEK